MVCYTLCAHQYSHHERVIAPALSFRHLRKKVAMMGPKRRFFIVLVLCTVFVAIVTAQGAGAPTPPPSTTDDPSTTTTTTTTTSTTTTTEPDEDEFPEDRPYYQNQWTVDSPPNKKKPYTLVLGLILGFTWAVLFSLATNVMSWCAFFHVYGHSYRIMWSLEEKLRVATKRLGSRKFGDDLMAQIRQMAPYDANRNDQEISTMLKSVNYSASKPAPQ
uniref:Conserved plasma membrane protein n=1 Tax=Panagrellus redivivus TaxID=6233 RepID=A0A7E4W6S3_PANRE